MMGREIKFRAWDKVFGRMIDDVYLCRNSVEFGGRGFDAMKDHYIPMQYTGLKDKNGRGIYDGDIIRFSMHFCSKPMCKDTVEWSEGRLAWALSRRSILLFALYNIEVIGNIYENPKELL